MSEEVPRSGVPMVAATAMLRPPPTRVGKIGPLTLPRTVSMVQLLAGAGGALAGLALSSIVAGIAGVLSFTSVLWGIIFGAATGVFLVAYSPLRGESMATWLGLQVKSHSSGRVKVDGQWRRVYIGIAPLHRTAAGKVHLYPGCVDVPLDTVDERGVLLTSREILLRSGVTARAQGSAPPAPAAPAGPTSPSAPATGSLAAPQPARAGDPEPTGARAFRARRHATPAAPAPSKLAAARARIEAAEQARGPVSAPTPAPAGATWPEGHPGPQPLS